MPSVSHTPDFIFAGVDVGVVLLGSFPNCSARASGSGFSRSIVSKVLRLSIMLFGSVFGSLRLSVRFLVTIIRESMLSIDSSLMLVLI